MKQNTGLTLVELLIGILLTSMIFLAASSLVVALFTSNTRTKQLDEVQQAKNDLINEISNAVKWSGTIKLTDVNGDGKTDLVVTTFKDAKGAQKTYTYTHDSVNDVLTKQVDSDVAEPFHTSGVNVTKFEVISRGVNTADTAPKSLDIMIELQDAQLPTIKEAFRVVASQRSVE